MTPIKLQTFAATTWGGSLFRIAISAVPFLVPLMLQLGFGMNAFAAGSLTLWIFIGNLGMKPATTPILRRFGFRSTLIVNGMASALSFAACIFIAGDTPYWILATVFCFGGLCRSMQFTAISTLTYVDVPKERMSGATALGSLIQQMTSGMGVAVGAVALHLAMTMDGRTGDPTAADFRIAFLMLTGLAIAGLV